MTLHTVFFSGKGTTAACAHCIKNAMGLTNKTYDWLQKPPTAVMDIAAGDALLLAMPVYGGYIPKICLPWVEKLQGHNTPAIIAAVYGNRHYDNALLQMKDLLEARGFRVIAAGAFLAEHSIFHEVAKGRPDDDDRKAMTAFGDASAALLAGDWQNAAPIQLPGDPNYQTPERKPAGMYPTADRNCINCRACADQCPGRAIPRATPQETDPLKCVQCGACIRICPMQARGYHSDGWKERAPVFAEKCAEYRKPETFFVK